MRVKIMKKMVFPHANGGGETVTILPGEEWVDVSDERIFFEAKIATQFSPQF